MSKLSELVAVRVMGFSVNKERSPYRWSVPLDSWYYRVFDGLQATNAMLPAWDTDIADAWRVVEKMKQFSPMIETYMLGGHICTMHINQTTSVEAQDENECVAICIAALRACGVPESEIEEARKQ